MQGLGLPADLRVGGGQVVGEWYVVRPHVLYCGDE